MSTPLAGLKWMKLQETSRYKQNPDFPKEFYSRENLDSCLGTEKLSVFFLKKMRESNNETVEVEER